ncbi:MAG TPA: hypothetical protein VIH76_03725 [Candidatus Acidoferrales bacterium]
MRRIIFALIALFVFTPGVFAQNSGSDHVNVGVYGDFVRLNSGDVNLLGVGGRVSFNVLPVVQIEAESGYNFEQGFSNQLSTSGGTVTYVNSDLRSVDVLAGPKLMTNRGPVRVFATVKGGFTNFLVSSAPATAGTYFNTFGNSGSNIYGVLYPGGGVEGFWGVFGLRFDVGDQIIFSNGAHNNLRLTFGPTIRF